MRRSCTPVDALLLALAVIFCFAGVAACLAPAAGAQTADATSATDRAARPLAIHPAEPTAGSGGLAEPAGVPLADLVLPAALFGVVPDSTVDNTPAIQLAVDTAFRERRPGQRAWVEFECGVFGWEGTIRVVPDSVGIRGCGGTLLTRDTTSATSPTPSRIYYPARRADRVLPGAGVTRLRVLDTALSNVSANGFVEPTRLRLEPETLFNGDRRFHRFWLEDLVLDGNHAAGVAAVERTPLADRKKNWQDRPTHTGLDAGRSENRDWCLDRPTQRLQRDGSYRWVFGTEVGTLITLRRVEITGFVATGVLGDYCSRWELDTVRFANASYNHVAYKADGGGVVLADGSPGESPGGELGAWGGWTDVTIAGGSWWDVVAMRGLVVQRLVHEAYERNPVRINGTAIINVRNHSGAVNCYAIEEQFPGLGGGELWDTKDPRASGYAWEHGLAPGDCEPPASKVVLPPVAGDRPSVRPTRQRYRPEIACRDRRTGQLVDGDKCPPARLVLLARDTVGSGD